MLKEEIYNLDTKENSPVIVLPWFYNCRVLIDTGATLPMWLKSITPLKLKGAVKENQTVNSVSYTHLTLPTILLV